jgi:toxin ParE1/3/4
MLSGAVWAIVYQDLQETLDFVRKYPLSGKQIPKNLRRFRLRKFKYNVVYVFEADEILIVAVAHHRRRPGYWLDRLGIIN